MRTKAKYPIYEIVNGKKKIIWKNLFKTNLAWLLLILFAIVLSLLYMRDTAECRDLISSPCNYIEKFNCFNETFERVIPYPFEEFNFSSQSNADEYKTTE